MSVDSWQNSPVKVRVAAGGRIVMPAEIRQELGVKGGDELLLVRGKNGIRLTTYRDAVRKARELVARYVRPAVSLADELSRERQEEAEEEECEERQQGWGAGKRSR